MITSTKNYTKKQNKTKKLIVWTLGHMVKAKLYKQNHTQKHTHTHSQKEKKEKKIYIIAPEVQHLYFGWFVFYSGIPEMQGTSAWLWRFNQLLLRLLGEISLSLLSSHSSWGSALDLATPLRVGCLRASVLRSDRMGLKLQLIWGLRFTEAGRRGGMECGVSLRWQRPAWRCSSLRCAVCSPGEVVPGSQDPGSGGLLRVPGGDSDLCLHTGFLVAAAATLAFHARSWCPRW